MFFCNRRFRTFRKYNLNRFELFRNEKYILFRFNWYRVQYCRKKKMVSIKLYYSCVRRAPFVRNQKRYKFLRRFTEKWKFSRNYKYLRSYARLFVKTKKTTSKFDYDSSRKIQHFRSNVGSYSWSFESGRLSARAWKTSKPYGLFFRVNA